MKTLVLVHFGSYNWLVNFLNQTFMKKSIYLSIYPAFCRTRN